MKSYTLLAIYDLQISLYVQKGELLYTSATVIHDMNKELTHAAANVFRSPTLDPIPLPDGTFFLFLCFTGVGY